MTDDELDIDEGEATAAAALAHALDRGSVRDGLPEEALQTAALLRYGAGASLDATRSEAILGEILEVAERAGVRGVRRPGRAGWRWLFGALGMGGAAAISLLLLLPLRSAPTEPTVVPTPSVILVRAQLARFSGERDDREFDDAMRVYRGGVYAALSERYGDR